MASEQFIIDLHLKLHPEEPGEKQFEELAIADVHEIKNWFTRFEQADVDPQYLVNMKDATNYFQAWFSGRHEAGFHTMLASMHRLASRGGYVGYTNNEGPQIALTSHFRGRNKEAWRPLLKKEWFGDVKIHDGRISPVVKSTWLRGSHHLVNRPGGYELHLPDDRYVLEYLTYMESAMASLRLRFCAGTLANYIQYFVVGHPFERINFSICMAQVNAILWHYGYEPLHHGWFDFECFVYDYDRIETSFGSRIKKRGG